MDFHVLIYFIFLMFLLWIFLLQYILIVSIKLSSVYMGYTYGDIFSSVFIFLCTLGFFYFAFWAIIKGVKVRN
jgi:hypothetical protein